MIEEQLHRAGERIQKAQSIWIFVPSYATLDSICAAVILSRIAKRENKQLAIVCPNMNEELLRYVPELQQLVSHPQARFGTRISFRKPLKNKGLTIIEGSESAELLVSGIHLERDDIITAEWHESCDLACLLGVGRRESFLEEFSEFQPLLHTTNTLLIDTRVSTEPWCVENLTRPHASGVCEIVFDLISQAFPEHPMESREATLAYMGIVDATRGFSTRNRNPKTYELIAKLLSLGADNTSLVQQLYFSKTMSELRAWGRALARLERDAYRKIIWTRISSIDLEKTGSNPAEARNVLDEMMTQTPDADIVCLFLEHGSRVEVGIRNKLGGFHPTEVFWKYSPLGGDDRMFFMVSGSLVETERMIMEELALAWDRLPKQ